jgi:hypothetical protein
MGTLAEAREDVFPARLLLETVSKVHVTMVESRIRELSAWITRHQLPFPFVIMLGKFFQSYSRGLAEAGESHVNIITKYDGRMRSSRP